MKWKIRGVMLVTASYDVDIKLIDGYSGTALDHWRMPITLDLRHAAMNRTWMEIGWFEYGIIPAVTGIWFIRYDPKVTPILINEIDQTVGTYISEEIVHRLNADPRKNNKPVSDLDNSMKQLSRKMNTGEITYEEYQQQLKELLKLND